MTDVIGWSALAVSLVGHTLAARGRRAGWKIRATAGLLWLAFALVQRSAPYTATALVYLAIDCYGAFRRGGYAK